MDPDANVQEQRLLKAKIKRGMASGYEKSRLRELQTALREWARRGGFPPRGYHRGARGMFVKNKMPKLKRVRETSRGRQSGNVHMARGQSSEDSRYAAKNYCRICRGPHRYKHGKA